MPDDEDISLDEKRVHGARRGATRAVVASGLGLATVAVSDDQIGRFGLAHRCVARDVAGDGRIAIATDDHVLVGDVEILEATEFGPAVAVGFAGSIPHSNQASLVAASPEGRIARRHEDEWVDVGTVEATVTSIDGDLVATDEGVYRIGDGSDSLEPLGLEGVRDVAGDGPLAATSDGVHRRTDDGWTTVREGDATVVASDGERAHAVVDGTLLERTASDADEDHEDEPDERWADAACPADGVVAVGYGGATYAVTGDGTFLVDPATAKDGAAGWRSRSLGLDDVVGLAVP